MTLMLALMILLPLMVGFRRGLWKALKALLWLFALALLFGGCAHVATSPCACQWEQVSVS